MPEKQYDAKGCKRCGNRFIPKKSWQIFCSKKCHNQFWVARRVNPDDRFVKIDARLDAIEKIINVKP